MGTLRIKRGTTANRTGITPAQAELVYDTDTKEVYVGDGNTLGGIAVSVSTQNLENLGNVQALTPQKDQLLVYNGSNWAATDNPQLDVRGNIYADDSTLLVDAINGKIVGPVQTSSVIATTFQGTLTGDSVGSHTGSVVGNVVGNVVGAVVGDLKGSVFADDSTVIIDANNNVINATSINATSIQGTLTGDHVGSVFGQDSSTLIDGINGKVVGVVDSPNITAPFINATGTAANGVVTLQYNSTSAVADQTSIGRIVFRENENPAYSTVGVTKDYYTMSPNPTGTADTTKFLQVWKDGRVQVGGEAGGTGYDGWVRQPVADLEVYGNVHMTGSKELLLGNMTTVQRDALTPANGMMCYNTTDNKFQGYENGAWANLI